MSQRVWVIVPQSPGVAVAMWISHPRAARRARVPAHRISASSGCARKDSATFRPCIAAMEDIVPGGRVALTRGEAALDERARLRALRVPWPRAENLARRTAQSRGHAVRESAWPRDER